MGRDLYFRYPQLDFNYSSRFLLRAVKSVALVVLVISILTLLLSDVTHLFLVGVFSAAGLVAAALIFLYWDKLRPPFKGGNLVDFTTRRSKHIITTAYDKAAFLGGSFVLHLLRELVDVPVVELLLKRVAVERDEFISKLEDYMKQDKKLKETRTWRQVEIEKVIIKALVRQIGVKKPIEPLHLFLALVYLDDERLQRIFGLFNIDPAVLERAARYYT
ncbi:MAG: hypothetical protein A2Y84_00555 [Candidatus Colwellbacteria bacterium RBG_13_48_8]|uniref:Clp R domain-containing protein n=1 Tax=Candidatus Colwellbacteria bacterium RBG_13_48_8 TaxID=1797685 RepID=A0A1G1YYQ8_9BACT|nr:MAG: hypothetical protein A2Y84_00555 [Candidatus Colwellbacteria bacterium RBG_13_48_8]